MAASAIAAGRSCPKSATTPITRRCATAAPMWWAHEAGCAQALLQDVRPRGGGGPPGPGQQAAGVPRADGERDGTGDPARLQPGEALQHRHQLLLPRD